MSLDISTPMTKLQSRNKKQAKWQRDVIALIQTKHKAKDKQVALPRSLQKLSTTRNRNSFCLLLLLRQ